MQLRLPARYQRLTGTNQLHTKTERKVSHSANLAENSLFSFEKAQFPPKKTFKKRQKNPLKREPC